MARFGLIGPSYRSQSVLADCQSTINWYPEAIESGMGRSASALYPTPGLNLLYVIGPAGMRGLTTLQGRTFAVQGTSLCELFAPNAAPNFKNWSLALGVNITSDGQPVSFAGGGHQLLFASDGIAYVFDLNTNTLAVVDPSAGANLPIAQVNFCFGFFFALVENQAPVPWQINASAPLDATNWNALAFAEEVEVFSDNPNALFTLGTNLWTFSQHGIQPYTNTGNFPFPFDIIPGTFVENGLAAPLGIAKFDNSFGWLGSDERGNGMIWRMNGFTPQRISNHAIEYALQGYPSLADAIASSYQDQGHSFLRFDFPSADKTWLYDAATQQFHERAFLDPKDGKLHRHRAPFHTFNFGMHLVGDFATGAVYQQAINIYSDFGNPIRRQRRAPHVTKEQERIQHTRVQVDVEVGLGPVPPLQGNQPVTVFTLADANGALYSFQVSDLGVLQSPAGSQDSPQPLFLNDPASNTSWQITVSTLGQVIPVAVTFRDWYPETLRMASLVGAVAEQTLWSLTVRQVAPGIAQLVTTPLGIVSRGPLMTLRWSNDGGQTWSNTHDRDCGRAGEFLRRVIWNRLGMARDRVYEISASDPVPWRIIDAYLMADGYEPSERLVKQMAKQA